MTSTYEFTEAEVKELKDSLGNDKEFEKYYKKRVEDYLCLASAYTTAGSKLYSYQFRTKNPELKRKIMMLVHNAKDFTDINNHIHTYRKGRWGKAYHFDKIVNLINQNEHAQELIELYASLTQSDEYSGMLSGL